MQCCACREDFEAAWQKAAADTDWQELAEPSQLASDQQVNEVLCQTELCHAAQMCYADPDHNLAQAFPPESVVDRLLDMTESRQNAAKRRLVEASLYHGEPPALLHIATHCYILLVSPCLQCGVQSLHSQAYVCLQLMCIGADSRSAFSLLS